MVVFDGEDGGMAGFDDADVIHDFDRFIDIGGRGAGIGPDLSEGVVSPAPCRPVFFYGKGVADASGGRDAFDVVHDFDGFDAFCFSVGDVAPCPELAFGIDVQALGGSGRKAFSERFIGNGRFSCNEDECNQ